MVSDAVEDVSTTPITLKSPRDGRGSASEDPIALLALTLPAVLSGINGRRRHRLAVEAIELDETGGDLSGYGVGTGTRAAADTLVKLDQAASGVGAGLLVGFGDESGGHQDEHRSRSTP